MNILVCIKQVPDTTQIKIDPVTNTLVRAGVPSIVNPFDAYALEMAAQIKDKVPDTHIVALSMGPEQAKGALKECLAVGADEAYLVSGREFGGSDTLATSYILSSVIRQLEEKTGKFDAIFCGKQAIDGDTAQVGPEIAEHLGLPQVTYAVEAALENGALHVKKETEVGYEVLEVAMPCVVTVTKPAFEPRYPTVLAKLASSRREIPVIAAADVDIDLTRCGLKGSPTKVKKSFTPPRKEGGIMLQQEDPAEAGKALCAMLSDAKII